MATENFVKQLEELEVLGSIYGDDFKSDPESPQFTIQIIENGIVATVNVTFSPDYPNNAPPIYELSAPTLPRKEKAKLNVELDKLCSKNVGESVVYTLVEEIRTTLRRIKGDKKRTTKPSKHASLPMPKCPPITHGEVIGDRKSYFQGHAAPVKCLDDVKAVLSTLKENKKILNATHNMYAYRIDGATVLQNSDNDGEAHAGGRMLHLLQILDQKNVLVVVSRWYGGIQLGPDRFRHINNAARQVLVQAGLLKQ